LPTGKELRTPPEVRLKPTVTHKSSNSRHLTGEVEESAKPRKTTLKKEELAKPSREREQLILARHRIIKSGISTVKGMPNSQEAAC